MKHNAYIEKKLGKEIDQVSREELIALVNEMKNEKKYGLVWENQVEEMEKLLETHYPMLQEDAEKAIVKDKSKPTNLIIEGDNLHSLNTLLYTHREKVDVIYIDPPYNTGNKDFVYNDRYVDKENSWRHSSWLSFIEKRLRLAKELMSENGVVFISIDDNEQAQLKLLCDEIMGENNFIIQFPRLTTKSGKSSSQYVKSNDYVLCYVKNKKDVFIGEDYIDESYKYIDSHIELRGKYNLKQPLDVNTLGYVKSLDYPIEIDGITYYPGSVTQSEYEKRKANNPSNGYRWRWSKELLEFGIKNEWIVISKTKRVYTKAYLNAKISKNERKEYEIDYSTRKRNISSLDFIDNEYSNDKAKKELDILNNKLKFDYPKPISLMKMFLRTYFNKNAVVLDFFAGSGTTGHAVLELNAEDGGNRQFILCTHGKESETSEVNIAEDITYERIKRVINGYTTPKGKEVDGLDGNVKYYKTILVDKEQDVNDLKAEMAQHAKDLLCIKDNAFAEVVSLEESFLFESNDVLMGIHLGEHYEIPESLTQPLAKTSKERILYLKVDDIPTDEEEVQLLLDAKINVKPIPKKIMDLFDESTRRSV